MQWGNENTNGASKKVTRPAWGLSGLSIVVIISCLSGAVLITYSIKKLNVQKGIFDTLFNIKRNLYLVIDLQNIKEGTLGVSIIDPTRPEDKWIEYGFNFFDPNRVGSGLGQPNPTWLIIFFEVILWLRTN
jgi:hypothetical protein